MLFLDSIFIRFKPKHLSNIIQKIIFPKCETLLDVGCGDNSVVQFFNNKLIKSIGVDIYSPALKKSKTKKIHNEYRHTNVLNISHIFPARSFDCVLSIDVLEHLKKNDAVSLLKKMELIAKKFVIIKTTNGYIYQGKTNGNVYQIHKCGFATTELKKMGYSVLGMDGPKILRGEFAKIKYHPSILFIIIANLLDPLFRILPSYSYNLLAYKVLTNK